MNIVTTVVIVGFIINNPLVNVRLENSFCAGLLRRTIPGRRSGESHREKAIETKDPLVECFMSVNAVAGGERNGKEIRLFENFNASRKENNNYNNNNDDTKTIGG